MASQKAHVSRIVLGNFLLFGLLCVAAFWHFCAVKRASFPSDTSKLSLRHPHVERDPALGHDLTPTEFAKLSTVVQSDCDSMSAMSLALPMRPFPLHVAVTVLLEDPSDLPEQADVSKVLRAVDSVVKLAEQSGLGRIRADAQLRFFGSLSSRAARRTRYAETDEFVLDTEDLSEFVGRTQWNLESMTHSARALNLLVYLPKREQRPLRFLDDNTNDNNNNNSKNKNNHNNNNKEGEGRSDTILVPRWGAIVSADDVSFLTEEQHQVHQRVRRLMRTLLGVPSTQQLSQVVPAASVDLRGLRWPLAVYTDPYRGS
ncbi:MAG: hypothetical protein MHM6MM_007918 [Cercozoa sp. M6MM]